MKHMGRLTTDLEVEVKREQTKAIIEGKTAVPFKTFVTLILQRKVLGLFQKWGSEPVIISTDLLTDIASSAQDETENKNQLVLVTLGTGVLCGVFCYAVIQIFLSSSGVTLGLKEHLFVAGSLLGIALLTVLLSRTQQKAGRTQKVVETMDRISVLLSKK